MLLENATLVDGRVRDVRVVDEQVAAVEPVIDAAEDEPVIDATDRLLLPGMIDVHVHFREPGFPHKETWTTGSKSAAAGGVTTVVDQPNTDPPTVTGPTLDRKLELAAASLVDYGVNGGVTPDWNPDELFSRPLFALGEVFLADSTGTMGITEELFSDAVHRATEAGVTVTVHAEDATRFDDDLRPNETGQGGEDADTWSAYRPPAAEISAVERACEIGTAAGARLHFAHLSTPEAVDIATDHGMTTEVTPHHILLSREDLPRLGTFGLMNPPLRSEPRRAALYERVRNGSVDLVATDHAPHTREEKQASIWAAPRGVPGVETALPVLLREVRAGRLSVERVRDLTAATPAERFDLPKKGRVAVGCDADLVLVDPEAPREIRGNALHGTVDWTPFEGHPGVFPTVTLVRGQVVYRSDGDDERFGEPVGTNVRS